MAFFLFPFFVIFFLCLALNNYVCVPSACIQKERKKPKFATDFLNKNLWKLKKESKNFKRIAYNLNNNLTIIIFMRQIYEMFQNERTAFDLFQIIFKKVFRLKDNGIIKAWVKLLCFYKLMFERQRRKYLRLNKTGKIC